MRTLPFLVLVVALLGSHLAGQESNPAERAGTEPAVSVPAFANANCPIMGKPVSTKLFVDTEYGRIYVCCVACNKKIRQDPQGTYKTAYPTTAKVGNTICPVTGEKIGPGSPTVTLQGKEVNICCKDCVKSAKANQQVFLVKALNPTAKVVGNKVCPVTGDPVEPNAVVLIGDELVSLSSVKCVEEVQKAPRAVLEKAKASAAKANAGQENKGAADKGHGEHKHGQEEGKKG